MSTRLARLYDNLVLKKPGVTLLVVALVTAFFAIHVPDFKLDASADSLILENDQALRYYRSVRARYGSDDNLIVRHCVTTARFAPVTARTTT